MRPLVHCFLVLSTLALARPASADDFTFSVPVRIENMRFMESAWVSCGIALGTTPPATWSERSADLPIHDGSYIGAATVIVNLGGGYTRADAIGWHCTLIYTWRLPDGTVVRRSLAAGERAALYERHTGQAVASTVEIVRGPIP